MRSAISCSCVWCPLFPFWFVNIAPAVLGVPLKTFVLGTVVGHRSGHLRLRVGGRRPR